MSDSTNQPTQQPQAQFLSDYKAPAFIINTVDLTVDISGQLTTVGAKMSVVRKGDHLASLVLDGTELNLTAIAINGSPLSQEQYNITPSSLEIMTAESDFILETQVTIDPANNTSLEGLYKAHDAFCTQCEAEGFRRITYFLDRPDVLCKYTTKIIANKESHPILLSNGNKTASGDLTDGKHFVTWEDPFYKPSYLFALVAGDFDVLTDTYTTMSGREVALEIFVDKGNLDKSHHAMESLKKSMKWDEDTFGLEYDLDIYMIVAVDFFNMGAMENKGLNIFNSKFVLANNQSATDKDFHQIESVIGHEYFHNWTGNRVTCRDWFQLSLKEGLTVFRDQQFSADMGSPAVNRINAVKVIRAMQFAEDAGPMAHAIRPEKVIQMNNFYTVTVYNKGAEVIRMMHSLLGVDGFRKGMDLYFERHDGTAVTCDDFVAAMEDASGVDLTQFRRWYNQAGTPVVTVKESYDEQAKTYRLDISQNTADTADGSPKLPFHIPFDIELLDEQGKSIDLVIDGQTVSSVLNVCEAQNSFVFEQVQSEPVPVLCRNFSAPVKVDFEYQNKRLLHIIAHSSDDFSRWNAVQTLYLNKVKRFIADPDEFALEPSFIKTFVALLSDKDIDRELLAELITLPSFENIASNFAVVDVEGINNALAAIADAMCQVLYTHLVDCYQANLALEFDCSQTGIAKRSLKNACLVLLSHTQYLDYDGFSKVKGMMQEQYIRSNNMTDTLAVLSACDESSHRDFFDYMRAFEKKWKTEPLVMDKWFALHARWFKDDIFDNFEKLFKHPMFNIENPNRVRALIGSFSMSNSWQFHRIDGKGYELLTDVIIKLNSINPQVASRFMTPLMSFKRYDETRQSLMRKQLERISAIDNLSEDLYEKVTQSLS